jgi:tetratricopeptide (TPR) repeat protein
MGANLIIGIGFLLLAGVLAFLSVKRVLGDGWLDIGDKIGSIIACLVGIWLLVNPFAGDKMGSAPEVSQEGSGNSQISGGPIQGNLTAGNNITATASEGGTAVINTGSGQVYITTLHGISAEQFQHLAEELGVTRSALKNFFHILEQEHVPSEALDSKLRQIAKNYKELQEKLEGLTGDDPSIMALKQEARQALEAGDFARVEQLLNQACEKDVEAAKQLQENAKKHLLSAAASKDQLGRLKTVQLAYREAVAYFRQAVDLVPQDVPLSRAEYMNDWGVVSVMVGDYAEARNPLVGALRIRERVLGAEHPDVAFSLTMLATLHVAQHHYDQVEPLATRALHIHEKMLGPEHPDVAQDLNLLGAIYEHQGKYDQAEECLKRTLTIDEKVFGPKHPHVATTWNNLAWVYRSQQKYELAESAYQRALTIVENALGPHHPQAAIPLNGLATLYSELGKPDHAEPLHQRAIAITEARLGPAHPDLVINLFSYAITLYRLHRDAEAETIKARAEAILNKRARMEGITGPVSWQVTALQAAKQVINGKEMEGYSFVLVLKELHGIGITFGTPNGWHLPPHGEEQLSFFFPSICHDRGAGRCDQRRIVTPAWNLSQNLILGGINDQGQTLELPVDIILPALP